MAHEFADLHDKAPRMKKKGVIREILQWRHARKFFYWRIRRRLLECDLRREISAELQTSTISQAGEILEEILEAAV